MRTLLEGEHVEGLLQPLARRPGETLDDLVDLHVRFGIGSYALLDHGAQSTSFHLTWGT